MKKVNGRLHQIAENYLDLIFVLNKLIGGHMGG